MHEVSVTILPHPISMFLLGFFLLAIILLYKEYNNLKETVKEIKNDRKILLDKMDNHILQTDEKIQFISKKVDSRVDKALLGIKNK